MFMLSGSRKPRESGIVAKPRRTNQVDPIPAAMSVVNLSQLKMRFVLMRFTKTFAVNKKAQKVLEPPSRAVSPRVARLP